YAQLSMTDLRHGVSDIVDEASGVFEFCMNANIQAMFDVCQSTTKLKDSSSRIINF
ncbi:hypothetical protein HW555_012413, partial [Spodoptera exigua]